MANWNRVWGTEGSSCGSASADPCPSSCYNYVGNAYDPTKSILNDFPSCVNTVAEALAYFARSLATRLGASDPVVQSTSDMFGIITLRLSRRADDIASIYLTLTSSGNYPVQCNLTYGVDKSGATFGSLASMEDWLVTKLRK